jgi:hypothetical protein
MFYNGKIIDISVNYEVKKQGKEVPYENEIKE